MANTGELILELFGLKPSEVMALASWIGRTMEKGDKSNELAWLGKRGELEWTVVMSWNDNRGG